MSDSENHETPLLLLLAIGLLAMLLFVALGLSLFVRGIPGIIFTGASAFGIGFLSSVARRRRPSPLWMTDLVGSLIGAVIAVLVVRDLSLQPRHYWNQWALFAVPFAALGGSVVAANEWVTEVVDRIL